MDKVTPDALVTFLWVGAALVALALAVWGLVDKIRKASAHRRDMESQLSQMLIVQKAQGEIQQEMCKGVLALLSHEINGNSIEKLTAAQASLTGSLVKHSAGTLS